MLHASLCHGQLVFPLIVDPISGVFSQCVLDMNTQSCAAQGLPMSRAGPPPLLKNVLLPGETRESAEGSKIVKNIQKGKGKSHYDSINSLLGEDFDLD